MHKEKNKTVKNTTKEKKNIYIAMFTRFTFKTKGHFNMNMKEKRIKSKDVKTKVIYNFVIPCK